MSSQGPTTSLPKSMNAGMTGSAGEQTSNLYSVDLVGIRDSSDWIRYKKRLLIVNEDKSRAYQDQGYLHGNSYRLDFLGGRTQVPNTACPSCDGGAYKSNGPF